MDTYHSLSQQFVEGKTPKKLDGFYRGELTLLLPKTLSEKIGGLLGSLYLPWKGKYFYAREKTGDNLIPALFTPFLRARFPKARFFGKSERGAVHAFPFKTSISKGIADKRNVFRLDYNLPQNPPIVRHVVDELVEVGNNNYLGKAFIIEHKLPRLIAFFRLQKH